MVRMPSLPGTSESLARAPCTFSWIDVSQRGHGVFRANLVSRFHLCLGIGPCSLGKLVRRQYRLNIKPYTEHRGDCRWGGGRSGRGPAPGSAQRLLLLEAQAFSGSARSTRRRYVSVFLNCAFHGLTGFRGYDSDRRGRLDESGPWRTCAEFVDARSTGFDALLDPAAHTRDSETRHGLRAGIRRYVCA